MIKKIAAVFLLLFLCSVSFSNAEEAGKKYPPYPDVCGYEFPWPEKNDRDSRISIAKMPDGDYMIRYIKKRTWIKRKDGHKDPVRQYGYVSFFTGKTYSMEEITILDKENKFSWMLDKKTQTKVVFKDGSEIGLKDDPVGNFYTSEYTVRKDRSGKILSETILMYLYDKPVKTRINQDAERNWEYKGKYYFEKVYDISTLFIPLEDDTFLLYDAGGNIIIRFDKDFKTKSSLINNKVFVLDRKKTNDILWKTGIDDQALNNDMADYLIKLKKEASNGTNK